eukprot:Clim_evm36s172 gene=Clim_evmTU36s172
MTTSRGSGHRAGKLKQQNKAHKHGKHKTKGQLDNLNKGKVDTKHTGPKSKTQNRQQRRQQLLAKMKAKKEAARALKKSIGGEHGAPQIILVLAQGTTAPLLQAMLLDIFKREYTLVRSRSLGQKLNGKDKAQSDVDLQLNGWQNDMHYFTVEQSKQNFVLLTPPRNLMAMLNSAYVADTILFLQGAEPKMLGPEGSHVPKYLTPFDEMVTSMIKTQGVPATLHCVFGLGSLPLQKKKQTRAIVLQDIQQRFPREEKFYTLDSQADIALFSRALTDHRRELLSWRQERAYLVADEAAVEYNQNNNTAFLHLKGYVRGRELNVNTLFHVSGLGDFQVEECQVVHGPFLTKAERRGREVSMNTDEGQAPVLPNPEHQDILVQEAEVDPMDAEQTFPTDEEIRAAEAEQEMMEAHKKQAKGRKVPKGTSSYQAAWFLDDDDDDLSDDEEESESDEDEEMQDIGDDYDMQHIDEGHGTDDDNAEHEEYEEVVPEQRDEAYDKTVGDDFDPEAVAKAKAERRVRFEEEQAFPDEIDTPMDKPARTRFQRYRGLKSFRTSAWDVNESLPFNYSRIFKFQNFRRIRKRVKTEEGQIPEATYIHLKLRIVAEHCKQENVDPSDVEESTSAANSMGSDEPTVVKAAEKLHNLLAVDRRSPVVVTNMLRFEHRMSVINVLLKRTHYPHEIVANKEPLMVQVGYRRFVTRPILSEHSLSDKHRMKRFLDGGHGKTLESASDDQVVVIATMYAPIFFPPAPVICFSAEGNSYMPVATGQVLSVHPDRLNIKKIILSGHPFKIHQRSAVIRFMFFNPTDIHYFKPLELWTKLGRRGHIVDSIGTHGHMKCVFDGPLKQSDTVCLTLYKRVFPKWVYQPLEAGEEYFAEDCYREFLEDDSNGDGDDDAMAT